MGSDSMMNKRDRTRERQTGRQTGIMCSEGNKMKRTVCAGWMIIKITGFRRRAWQSKAGFIAMRNNFLLEATGVQGRKRSRVQDSVPLNNLAVVNSILENP